MRDLLTNKMGELLDEQLKDFFSSIESDYHLPKNTLWKRWEGVAKKEKKSEYQNFFSIQRNKMVKDNPNITFGEISKQVSVMWKSLSTQEKQQYAKEDMRRTVSLDHLRKDYAKMAIQELKEKCKEKGIVKLRKKDDMISALLEWEEKQPHKQEITKGRSKLELSAEDKEEEEEDFYFHDDENSLSDNDSRICAEDDALLISDDDDIFDDED